MEGRRRGAGARSCMSPGTAGDRLGSRTWAIADAQVRRHAANDRYAGHRSYRPEAHRSAARVAVPNPSLAVRN